MPVGRIVPGLVSPHVAVTGLQGWMKQNLAQLQDVTALPRIGNATWGSETIVPHSLQDVSRFEDRFHGRVDMHTRTLDASAHLEDVNEAVMQDVVDVVGQTLNGRAADIFDALSTMRSLQIHDATTEPKSSEL